MAIQTRYNGLTRYDQAVFRGDAFRVSRRETGLGNGAELILHIDPDPAAGSIAIEAPNVNPKASATFDVWENADPGANLNDDWIVHNMDYDAENDDPVGLVQGVDSGGLTTTGADQTEEDLIDVDNSRITTGGEGQRAIYRNIPPTDTISIIITNTSGGGADFSVTLTIYEGGTLPQ